MASSANGQVTARRSVLNPASRTATWVLCTNLEFVGTVDLLVLRCLLGARATRGELSIEDAALVCCCLNGWEP